MARHSKKQKKMSKLGRSVLSMRGGNFFFAAGELVCAWGKEEELNSVVRGNATEKCDSNFCAISFW